MIHLLLSHRWEFFPSSKTHSFPQESPEKLPRILVAMSVMALGPRGVDSEVTGPRHRGHQGRPRHSVQMEQQRRKGPALRWDKRQEQSQYCLGLLNHLTSCEVQCSLSPGAPPQPCKGDKRDAIMVFISERRKLRLREVHLRSRRVRVRAQVSYFNQRS